MPAAIVVVYFVMNVNTDCKSKPGNLYSGPDWFSTSIALFLRLGSSEFTRDLLPMAKDALTSRAGGGSPGKRLGTRLFFFGLKPCYTGLPTTTWNIFA